MTINVNSMKSNARYLSSANLEQRPADRLQSEQRITLVMAHVL